MTAQGLAQRLRRETQAAHAALEAILPMARGQATLIDYRDHLRYLLSVHEPLEVRLKQVPGIDGAVPDLADRWKTSVLRDDLGGLSPGPRPPSGTLPDPQAPTQALGIMYVLEGATLGARTLLPELRAAGVIPGPVGCAYLKGYGSQTSLMWKRFCAALERTPSADGDEVASWATATFTSLMSWRREWEARS